jgi:FMN phosphatase YigB (HAD superfamily)
LSTERAVFFDLRKPASEIFQRAARRRAVDPANSVRVGDNPDADVRGAKSSGMHAIRIRDDFWPDATDHDRSHRRGALGGRELGCRRMTEACGVRRQIRIDAGERTG